jgi:hypothetical protein
MGIIGIFIVTGFIIFSFETYKPKPGLSLKSFRYAKPLSFPMYEVLPFSWYRNIENVSQAILYINNDANKNKSILIESLFATFPWSDNPMEDMSSVEVKLIINDIVVFDAVISSFDLYSRYALASSDLQDVLDTLKIGDKTMKYVHYMVDFNDNPFKIESGDDSKFIFKFSKPIKFQFGYIGLQKRLVI